MTTTLDTAKLARLISAYAPHDGSFDLRISGLMVSRLPTFSFKKGRVPRHLVLPSLLGAALVMGVIVSAPWIGLSLLGLVYLCLIPFSWFAYQRQASRERALVGGDVIALRTAEQGSPSRE